MKSPLRRTLRPLLWVPATLFGVALAWTASAIPLERASHHARTVAAVGRHAASQKLAAQNPALRRTPAAKRRAQGSTTGGPPTAIPLYTFTGIPDGLEPQGRLLQTSDGNFYGVTTRGGSFGFGSIYRLTPEGKVTVLASFPETQGGPRYPSGPLVEGLNTDGTPNGAFYGVTEFGGDTGNQGKGTVYLFAADGGSPTGFSITRLYSFTGGADGGSPLGALTVGRKADGTPDGYLYGTASSGGGASGDGVVFRVPQDGFAEDVLHTFPAPDGTTGINSGGAVPKAGVLQRHDATGWGKFYGTTALGGVSGYGTVFSLTSAGAFVTLHDFQDSPDSRDGHDPEAGLVQSADGALYGTTFGGGNGSGGTVYRLAPDAKSSTGFTYSQIASMGLDTRFPKAALIEASDGKLYGTSEQGGSSRDGSVFRIDADPASPTGYSATALHVFTYTESGGTADSELVQGTDGDLYGVTAFGGTNTDGTIYRLNVVPPKKAAAPTITSAVYFVANDGSAQYVTLQGDHFVSGASVTVDGTPAQSVTFGDVHNLVSALGHLLSAGTHTVVVTNPDGQSASAPLTTLDAPGLTGATALTDNNGKVFLLVTGNNFGTPGYNGDASPDGTVVTVRDSNGFPISAPTVLVPPATPAQPGGPQDVIAALDTTGAAPGAFSVTITNSDNQSSQSQTFTVYPFDQTEYAISVDPSLLLQAYQLYLQSKGTPAPGPTSNALKGEGKSGRTSLASGAPQISPPIGYQVNPNGTATVTINGTNFRVGGKVYISTAFTGTSAQTRLHGSGDVGTQLIVTESLALPAGDHTVTVINPDGQTATATFSVFPSSPTQVVLGAVSFGVPVPLIDIAAGGTSGIATAATGLLSPAAASLISQDGGGIVSHDSGGLVASGGGNLITQDGAGIVSHDSGGIVSHDSGGLVASGGGNIRGNIREPQVLGSRVAGGTNSVAVTGLVADIASDAGHTGSLGLTPHFGPSALARLKAHALPNAPLTFFLNKHDAGPARGKGATELTASLNYADGTSALLLDLRVAPGQPDVVVYQAPGVTLKPRGTTPAPQVSSLAPTLTSLSPSTAPVGSPGLTLAVTGTLFTAAAVVNWNGAPLATTVLSGTQATAVVPTSLLSAAGTAQVTVANPAPGGGDSAPLPFIIAPAFPTLHTFPAGLQMISVPEDYANVGLSAALSDSTHPLVVWNPATSVYDPHTDLHPGVGYWVRLSKPTDLYDVGAPAPTSALFPVPLQAGWNMIGDPFPTPVALAGVRVRDTLGREGTFRQAVSARVVSGTLLAYPAGATQYQEIGPDGSLTPFVGCWIYAPRPCTLLVPAH
jgi:uncharacterized repeat protein (TIGR03803 family)